MFLLLVFIGSLELSRASYFESIHTRAVFLKEKNQLSRETGVTILSMWLTEINFLQIFFKCEFQILIIHLNAWLLILLV